MTQDHITSTPVVPNAKRLLWAGFMAILAAGVGFAIRNSLLNAWGGQFGFSDSELGTITGAGLTGFCFGIIIGGVIADKIGYGKLVIAAFAFHVLSAFVTFAATDSMDKETVFQFLYWGSFIFAVANGTLEAVANPLVATVFPNNRTHYLNILHASWPAGLVLGGFAAAMLGVDGQNWGWKAQLSLFLVPTAIYGLMFLGQKMPKSEASEQGLSLGEMFKDVGILGGLVVCALVGLFLTKDVFSSIPGLASVAPYIGWSLAGAFLIAIGVITKFSIGSFLLFILFVTHALVGAVELGTDTWIQNITGVIFTPSQGNMLFIFTSALMFILRFCAESIEKKVGLNPVGLLLVCSILACIGLNLTAGVSTYSMAFVALGVYGLGKTFFWPTMLAVTSDRFPRTGAVAISIMGGIGMLSAGMLGGPGLGYFKDRYSGEALAQAEAPIVEEYRASEDSKFLSLDPVRGIDPVKLKGINDKLAEARKENADATYDILPENEQVVVKASIQGSRSTLRADSAIPAIMAVIYLLLFLYFKSIGGYKPVHLAGTAADALTDEDESIPAHESEEQQSES